MGAKFFQPRNLPLKLRGNSSAWCPRFECSWHNKSVLKPSWPCYFNVTLSDVEEAAPERSLIELSDDDIKVDWELWWLKRLQRRPNNELLVLGINRSMNSYNLYALTFCHVLFLFLVLLQNKLFTYWKWWKFNKRPASNKRPPWKSKN